MRQLERERRTVWASLYESREPVTDEDGYLTGEYEVTRKLIEFRPTVSPASGALEAYGFGTGGDYERTLVIDQTGTGMDENTVFWIDATPELNADGTLKYDEDGNPTVPWDYVAARPVSESMNYTNVAVMRADA